MIWCTHGGASLGSDKLNKGRCKFRFLKDIMTDWLVPIGWLVCAYIRFHSGEDARAMNLLSFPCAVVHFSATTSALPGWRSREILLMLIACGLLARQTSFFVVAMMFTRWNPCHLSHKRHFAWRYNCSADVSTRGQSVTKIGVTPAYVIESCGRGYRDVSRDKRG